MQRSAKIVSLAIGVTAFAALAILGFAIWVFIPLLPAGIVFLIAIVSARRRKADKPSSAVDADYRKAA